MSREKSQLWSGIAGSGPVRFRRRGWGGLYRPLLRDGPRLDRAAPRPHRGVIGDRWATV